MAEKQRKLGEIVLTKVDEALIDQTLRERQLATGGNLAARVLRLADSERKKLQAAPDRAVRCTECGGVSDNRSSACPFCGETSEEEAGASGGDYTVTDLNKAVEKLRRIRGDQAVSDYAIGREISALHEKGLWKLRLDGAGKPKYVNFREFCIAELGMTATNARMLMAVSKTYTEEEVREFGYRKLGVSLQVPEPERHRLIASMQGGASRRELESEAVQIRTDAGEPPVPRKEPPPPVTPRPLRSDQITIAVACGTVLLPMMSAKNPDRPATSVSDEPCCTQELTNDVVASYKLGQNRAGELQLVVEFRRPDSAAGG